ncbi:MAG TPA: hypothetical protein VG734_27115 [Lacunisphaera sp.]|nr:hypothetical protein [Lacunisphaera sp.]
MPLTPAPASAAALKAILWGGLLAGLGDFFFAHCFYAWKLGVFQNVAGGIMGREAARAGGMPTYLLGVGLHFLIATIWAAIFWVLSQRLPVLVRNAVPSGLVDVLVFLVYGLVGLGYGLVVYLGMNCIVVPFSALNTPVKLPPLVSWPAAAHMALVGLPIALAAWRFSRSTAEHSPTG